MNTKVKNCVAILCAVYFGYIPCAHAYWVWTPGSKKFINPKYAVKDTPEEQFAWAMGFFNAQDHKKAVAEFEKLIKSYEFSEYAAKAQFYVGMTYEKMGKPYMAFQSYQKVIDNYPYSEDLDEVIHREFEIGNYYLNKVNPRLFGTDILGPIERAVEIYKKVVENAPYGSYASEAQYNLGVALKKAERYGEAVEAFQRLLDEYPNDPLVEKAKYEIALSAYKASLSPAYDQGPLDKAISAFKNYIDEEENSEYAAEADRTLQRLQDRAAQKIFDIAAFYEKQKKYQSAITYYQEVINTYPDSIYALMAARKMGNLQRKIGEK